MRNRAIANGYNVGDVYESVDGHFGFRSNDQFGRQYFNKTDFGPQGGGFWNWTQTAIEGVGLIPALGEPADIFNGAISGVRGFLSGENSHYLEGSLHIASAAPFLGWGATAGKVALAASPLVVKKVTKDKGSKIVGLGVDKDLKLHRGTDAIIYNKAGWQNAGLTKVDWGRASSDNYYFKESFHDAVTNAGHINFNITNFTPYFYQFKRIGNKTKPLPNVTNYEFDYIINRPHLLQKTTFLKGDGIKYLWNGKSFIKK